MEELSLRDMKVREYNETYVDDPSTCQNPVILTQMIYRCNGTRVSRNHYFYYLRYPAYN